MATKEAVAMTEAVTQVKPKSNYITGFCATGAHEGSTIFSPSGSRLVPCRGRYEVRSGHGKILVIVCTCECHAAFDEIRQMMAMMDSMHKNDAISDRATVEEIRTPTVGPTPGDRPITTKPEPFAPVLGGLIPPIPTARERARNFTPTPTGRAARGQLEEQVRQVVAKFHEVARGMLTPKLIGLYISKEKPPSNGAIYAILDRWSKGGLVELETKPFRFERFTELGERKLLQ